jgi:ribosomal protein S18 acetylase RimI-like enzyme
MTAALREYRFAENRIEIENSDGANIQRKVASMIDYRTGNDLDLDVVIDLYRASTLGERRPVDDRERMATMLRNANLVVTAWDAKLLVGIARSLTDFSYATYLSDLAVRVSHQRSGIGKELIRRTQQAGGPHALVVLLAAPAAVDYYPHLGFTQHCSAWTLSPGDFLR